MRWILFAIIVSQLWACDSPHGGAGDGGIDAVQGQGAPASAALVINEISPRSAGESDWIELLNRSAEPIDLCGYFVTDALDRLDHYTLLGGDLPPAPCTPRWLAPGAYLLITADDSIATDHARFELGGSDEVHLVSTAGIATESLAYFYAASEGQTLARTPNGEGLFFPAIPTPGEANPAEVAP